MLQGLSDHIKYTFDSETGGTKKFDATKVGYLMGQNIAAEYNSSAQ